MEGEKRKDRSVGARRRVGRLRHGSGGEWQVGCNTMGTCQLVRRSTTLTMKGKACWCQGEASLLRHWLVRGQVAGSIQYPGCLPACLETQDPHLRNEKERQGGEEEEDGHSGTTNGRHFRGQFCPPPCFGGGREID